jgi:hypothetical protein
MKKILSILIVVMALCQHSYAYDFYAVASSGQTLYYNITNNTNGNRTVEVTSQNTSSGSYYSVYPTGSLVIPSTVTHNGNSYSVTNIGSCAFYNCSELDSLTIPNSVISIGDYAFKGCSGIVSVIIPNSVTTIGNEAFASCGSLTYVSIPNSVVSIGNGAFYSCNSLPSVIIPNSVSSIGVSAFNNVRHIEYHGNATGAPWKAISINGVSENDFVFSNNQKDTLWAYIGNGGNVTIPSTVTTIRDRAFYFCKGLISVVIPNSVNSMGGYVFQNCSDLVSVIIGDSVTSIGSYVFVDCSGLTSVTIPNSVTSIGHDAFAGCSSLTSVIIPNSVTSIGYGAFSGCSGLTTMSIPNSVTIIGGYAFKSCSGLTSLNIGNSVTSIGDYAFSGCCSLSSVYIPRFVTSIGGSAFNSVRHIEYYGSATGSPWGAISINGFVEGDYVFASNQKNTLCAYIGSGGEATVPSTVTTIRDKAFNCCKNLTSVYIPNTVTSIGNYAFNGCCNLASVNIPNSITMISLGMFYGCSGITSISIPDSVTSIGDYAFSGCSGLTSATIPNSVISIGSKAFGGCSGLTSVTISNSVTLIASGAFGGCSGLTHVTIPNSVTSIGSGAFGGCSGLTHVTIPNSVTSIGSGAFGGCSGLTSIYIPNTITSIGEQVFMGCTGLITLDIPNSITTIDSWAFANCSGLKSVTIPNSVTSIGNSAFKGCSGLTSVIIGNSITSIRPYAFEDCDSLASFYMNGIIPPWIIDLFGLNRSNNFNRTFYVPCGTSDEYQMALCGYPAITISTAWSPFHINVAENDSTMGDVSFTADICDSTIVINATPAESFRFIQWIDGDTNATRVVYINCDTSFLAIFDTLILFNVSLYADTNTHGTCFGGGSLESHLPHTIAANANYGYHFTQWNDGDTNNPRIITLTQDTSFTALFAKNSYNVTVNSSDLARGNVTGDTTMLYLGTVSIAATANYGYHFTQWSDGNIDNPRVIILTRDTILTALFSKNNYSITLAVDSSVHGSVTGAGTHEYLDDCTVSAIANYGYHFTVWNDGDTTNPRTITLTQDTTFTALFAKNTYTITAISNDTIKGMVAGNSSVEYLDSVTITAMPNYGYHFTAWNDGNTSNPRTIEATRDSSFTAYFDYNQYSITLNVDTNIHGLVTGGGLYNYTSEQTITATPNYGYHFTSWNDGDTTNPRTITLTQDTVFTALFAKNSYNVTVVSADTIRGNVTGNTTTEYLNSVSIAATANYGYHFLHWNDGDTANPRVITLTQDTLLTAYFAKNWYTVIGISENETMGYVTGSDTVEYLDSVSLLATSNYGYHFSSWNDGDTNNPRVVCITQDTTFTALFANNQYTLTVQSNDETQGSVSNGGVFDYLDTVTIIASAGEHYHFVRWDDGNTDNPREYVIVGDATLTAIFAIDTHTVTVTTNDIARGMVEATGSEFSYGTPCTVTATAYTGYVFSHWSNGITANPYTFAVLEDTELIAIFEEEGAQGIDDVDNTDNIRIFSKYDRIIIDGLNGQDVTIYTIDGRTIASLPRATEHVAIPITTTGVYIVKIGAHPARKAVVIR